MNLQQYILFATILVLMFSGCYKNDVEYSSKFDCPNPPEYQYKYSPNINSWFSASFFKATQPTYIQMSSSTGLTESMEITVSHSYFTRSKNIDCDTIYKYPNETFNYHSTLYNINLKITRGYIDQWGDYTGTYVYGDFPYKPFPIDSGCIILSAPYPMVRFDLLPDSNRQMNRPIATTDYPFYRFSIYDDCLEYIGEMTVSNKVFSSVFKIKNTPALRSGSGLKLSNIWIDKTYGVIQLEQNTGVIWSMKFN